MRFRLIALRHGITQWNRERRYQGCADTPLSEKGQVQAEAVAHALASLPLTAVYSSPLRRAQETAAAIACPHTLPVIPDPAFREICHGLWEGLTVREVRARFPDVYAAWRARPHTVTMPSGESLAQVRERVREGLEGLGAAHHDGIVCLVTHGVTIRLLVLEALDLPLERFWSIRSASTGISEIEFDQARITVHRINTVAHLRGSGSASAPARDRLPLRRH